VSKVSWEEEWGFLTPLFSLVCKSRLCHQDTHTNNTLSEPACRLEEIRENKLPNWRLEYSLTWCSPIDNVREIISSHHRSMNDPMVMKWFPFSLFSDKLCEKLINH